MSEKEGGVDPNAITMAAQAATAMAASGKMDKTMEELDHGLASALSVVFAPFNAIAAGKELAKGLAKRVAAKLRGMPDELRQLPPGSVSGPLLLNYVLLGEAEHTETELRELYAGLLASAIDERTASKAHPSYAHIIANMTAKEAQLFKDLFEDPNDSTWPCIRVAEKVFGPIKGLEDYGEHPPVDTSFRPWADYYDLPTDAPLSPDGLSRAVLSLERLGLLTIVFDAAIAEDGAYDSLTEWIGEHTKQTAPAEMEFDLTLGILRISALGHLFGDACIR